LWEGAHGERTSLLRLRREPGNEFQTRSRPNAQGENRDDSVKGGGYDPWNPGDVLLL
jgi:hypothetical protein